MIFDTRVLKLLADRCFDLSMNGALSQETRDECLAQGKRLRAQLTQLLSAQFTANTPEVAKATKALTETNQALTDAANDLAKVVKAVSRLAEVAGYVDQALKAAGKIV